MTDNKDSMVGMVYVSSLLIFLFTTVFNLCIFFDILPNYRGTFLWVTAAQGWILPGVLLLISNITCLQNTIWNKKGYLPIYLSCP